MDEVWKLDDYQKLLEAELIAALTARNDPDLDPEELVEETYSGLIPKIADQLYSAFADRSEAMLREHRNLRRGFVTRNKARWRGGFDLLERLIVISEETGSAINNTLRPKEGRRSQGRHLRGRDIESCARDPNSARNSDTHDRRLSRWRYGALAHAS